MIITLTLLVGAVFAGMAALDDHLQGKPSASKRVDPTPEPAIESDDVTALVPSTSSAAENEAPALGDYERLINRSLTAALGSLTLSISGFFLAAPLSVMSAILTLYAAGPLFSLAYHAISKERRLRASVVDSMAVAGAVISGYYVAASIAAVLYYTTRKILLKTEDRSHKKLINLFGEELRTAWLVRDGVEIEVQIEQLKVGDIVVVSAGQVVPIDGIVHSGSASIDQHKLTGEEQPVDRGPGERVLAATFVLAGRICLEVERTGASTVAAQIGAILNQTADYRALIESRGERLADQVALPLLGLSTAALATVGASGMLAIMNSNFADNMRTAVPLSMLNTLSTAGNHRILIKDGRVLEILQTIDTVVFDKTGTLTMDQPQIGEIRTCDGISNETLLAYAAAAEFRVSHPAARAILQEAAKRELSLPALENASYQMGFGIDARIAGHRIRVGSDRFMEANDIAIPAAIQHEQTLAQQLGYSLIYVAIDDKLGGVLQVRPTVRAEVQGVVEALRQRGLSLYIISGDHETSTRSMATALGIDHYFAEVLPQEKASLVKKLQAEGHKVCFVGDGINDAIALKTADASVSLSGATTAATDTAQTILLDGNLRQLPHLFQLAADFNHNTNRSLWINGGTAFLCIGGVFFLGIGVYGSMALYYLSMAASVANSMLPALKESRATQERLEARRADTLRAARSKRSEFGEPDLAD